jgi:hypothetical protein
MLDQPACGATSVCLQSHGATTGFFQCRGLETTRQAQDAPGAAQRLVVMLLVLALLTSQGEGVRADGFGLAVHAVKASAVIVVGQGRNYVVVVIDRGSGGVDEAAIAIRQHAAVAKVGRPDQVGPTVAIEITELGGEVVGTLG